MAAIRYRRIFTLILFVCLLLGAAAADEILDAPSLSSCLDCGFPEGHDPSCLAYVPDSHVPDAPVEPPVSSEEELPSSDPLPEDIPVEPLSFAAEKLLSAANLSNMHEVLISLTEGDVSLLYQMTADEISILRSHASELYVSESTEENAAYLADIENILGLFSGESELISVYGGAGDPEPPTDDDYIYFDLAAGSVTIDGSNYKGYVYKDKTQYEISGKHSDGNKYYIYQTNGSKSSEIPNYGRVGHPTDSEKYWGDYITNNTNVEGVIDNWSVMATKVGRTETDSPYRISVEGGGTYNITIDNLWSSYQYRHTSRTTGGLSFTPDNDGTLTVHLVGDNRFGNVHYDATENQEAQIIFNSSSNLNKIGTLTVANLANAGDYFGANHYNSVIGGCDGDSSQDSVGIIINGGIIFAGATTKDDCTAIGGGGNGVGNVTITGGTVTAVSTSSGTAIGGGIGESSMGGKGYVTITGGNVYAYNFGYVSQKGGGEKAFIPSAAIGGGSSRSNVGNIGQVTITGGNVYARSLGGTAIGGGSSTMMDGGIAVVTISGGIVTALSTNGTANGYLEGSSTELTEYVPSAGTGIGGGTAGMLGKGSGGVAQLTVSGDAEVNTGSIGGGGVANTYGSIGKAVVTIFGGTLLGQVIMEGEGSNFRMEGGVIDNTNCAGYNFLKGDGGAVWIKAGNAQMSGGTINNTRGDKGGAIYVEGGSFTMSGGNITDVSAGNGGAIYVSGGTVTMSGGNITNVSAESGGAVYVDASTVDADSFTMRAGTIQNAQATEGNGGAVAVANGKASMSGGYIKESTATTGDGGAVSISGGSFLMSGGTIGGDDLSTGSQAANGGAVSVSSGSFTMNAGTIQFTNATSGNGGAVNVTGGDFIMSGGFIQNTTAYIGSGGAVAVNSGTFSMSDGTIQNCTATGNGGAVYVNADSSDVDRFIMRAGTIQNCTASNGGAVSVSGGDARMENGVVKFCNATSDNVVEGNGGAVAVSNGNFTILFGNITSCTATGNGGAVYVDNGKFVMDSGNLTKNRAGANGGGAYVSGSQEITWVTIGNISCNETPNPAHIHPTTKDNTAENGGAFAVSGGELTIYCGEYSGNNATDSNSDSIYQTNGKVSISKGIDGEYLPYEELVIVGTSYHYIDARSDFFRLILYRNLSDTPVTMLIGVNQYHSVRLNKTLLMNQTSLYPDTELIGWSTQGEDSSVPVMSNLDLGNLSGNYYPENSRYSIQSGEHIAFYAVWGLPIYDKNYTIIIPDTIAISADGTGESIININSSKQFTIPNEVGRLLVTLSDFSGNLIHSEDSSKTLKYSITNDTDIPLKNGDIVASFKYNVTKNYADQDVMLRVDVIDEPKYAGTYRETVTFTISFKEIRDADYHEGVGGKTCYMGNAVTPGVTP